MFDGTDRVQTAEYRLGAAQDAMRVAGFDALLLINSTNLLFLSGYPALERTLARPHFLLVPQRNAPVFLVHEGRAREARLLSWVPDVQTYQTLSRAPLAELRAIFGELGRGGGRVGVELGYEQRLGMPVVELERMRAEFPRVGFDDAAALLWDLRMVKSPADIASIRRACAITAAAYDRTFGSVKIGDIDRAIAHRMQAELARGGGDPWVNVSVGPESYDLATSVGLGRPCEPGDMVWMDAGCTVDSLWSDFSRAGIIGAPSREQEDAHRIVQDITRTGVRMVRPGVRTAEIAARCNMLLEEAGLPVTSWVSHIAGRIGHGVGLDITEPPHVSTDDDTTLRPGMVISIEPGVATPFGMFHVEENVAVTPDGHEVLSRSPGELRRLGA